MAQVYVKVPKPQATEGNSFPVVAYYRLGDAGTTPTNGRYRIDCLTTGNVVKDWTTLSISSESSTITITATENSMQDAGRERERKQITVQVDFGLDTQASDTATWILYNNEGF